jgi:hypothetical protein
MREGDDASPPERHAPGKDSGSRAHNAGVDKPWQKPVSRRDSSPPMSASPTPTGLPLFRRDLLVTDQSASDGGADWPRPILLVHARNERNRVPIATCPMPPLRDFQGRGEWFGAHNPHENVPLPTCRDSAQVIIGTVFSRDLRAFDISEPFRPRAIGHSVPEAPRNSAAGAIQLNGVFVDQRGIVHAVDRSAAGHCVLQMDVRRGRMGALPLVFPAGPGGGPFGRWLRRPAAGGLPFVLITGFLGAGKTTLLRALLETSEGRGTAAVVNEFGEVGLDQALLAPAAQGRVALLGNGCLCCLRREPVERLLHAVLAL